jgi:hypothetical protein
MRDPRSDPRVRLHVPRTISRFGTQEAADLLFDLLSSEPSGLVRYKILRGLGRLVSEHKVRVDRKRIEEQMRKNLVEYLRLLALKVPIEVGLSTAPEGARGSGSLVVGLLDDKMRQSLERAFRLLQISHKHEDIRSVFYALSSKDKRVRANALEFLDALSLDPDAPAGAREMLHLIADDLPPAERVARAAPWLPRSNGGELGASGYQPSLRALLREKDASLAALAAYHALELDEAGLRDEVDAAVRERPSLALPGLAAVSLRAALGAPA